MRIDTNTRYISNFLHFKNSTLLEKFQEKSNVFKNTVSLTRHENPQESVRGAIASRPVTEDENIRFRDRIERFIHDLICSAIS